MAISMSSDGVVFPASFSNSTNANTLDDYEEGHSSDPTLRSSGNETQHSRTGNDIHYAKCGKIITCLWEANVQAQNSGTGALEVSMPFTSTEYGAYAVRNYSTGFNTSYRQGMVVQPNYDWLQAQEWRSSTSSDTFNGTGYWYSGWSYLGPHTSPFLG